MSEQTATLPDAAIGDGVLINPSTYDGAGLDPESARMMKATVEWFENRGKAELKRACLLYTSPSPRDGLLSRMPSSA